MRSLLVSSPPPSVVQILVAHRSEASPFDTWVAAGQVPHVARAHRSKRKCDRSNSDRNTTHYHSMSWGRCWLALHHPSCRYWWRTGVSRLPSTRVSRSGRSRMWLGLTTSDQESLLWLLKVNWKTPYHRHNMSRGRCRLVPHHHPSCKWWQRTRVSRSVCVCVFRGLRWTQRLPRWGNQVLFRFEKYVFLRVNVVLDQMLQ